MNFWDATLWLAFFVLGQLSVLGLSYLLGPRLSSTTNPSQMPTDSRLPRTISSVGEGECWVIVLRCGSEIRLQEISLPNGD